MKIVVAGACGSIGHTVRTLRAFGETDTGDIEGLVFEKAFLLPVGEPQI